MTALPARRRSGRRSSAVPTGLGSAYVASRRRRTRRQLLGWVAQHAFALAVGVAFVAPLLFVFLTSVMTDDQALTSLLWPRHWVWSNYVQVFRAAPLATWLLNSVMYAVLATAFTLVSSLPVAYALARLRFRGRRFALLVVIGAMMLPPQVTVVPLYIVWARFHLTGTLWPLIIPTLFGDAFSIFLLRQFLTTIPDEYSDAARVDGCGELAILVRVILPMIKPAIAAVGLFEFFYAWNDYYGPLVFASENPQHWTLSIGLASFRALHHVQWNLTMAATLLVTAPVLVLFVLAQRAFIQGVTFTGVKG
jgi:multiple sugar transport system permease protein